MSPRIKRLVYLILVSLIVSSAIPNHIMANATTESVQRTIFVEAPGHPKIISATSLEWQIVIPEVFNTLLAMDGNYIFQKPDNPEMIYVQIYNMKRTADSLANIAKESVDGRLGATISGLKNTLESDVSRTTINDLEYYTAIIKTGMDGSSVSFYNYCYFTKWDDLVFEFANTTPSNVLQKEFEGVVKSFSPVKAQIQETGKLPSESGEQAIKVVINGNTMSFDVPPMNVNGRILVPLRAIFEEMGAMIDYDSITSTVIATKGDRVVRLTIGDTSPTVNNQVTPIDQPAIIVDGRTLAPLRFVAEAFSGKVVWDGATQTAYITK